MSRAVVAQAAAGAALVWLAWLIGHDLFDRRVGLMAAAMTAANPYAVVHDTALQETSLFNVLMAGAMYLLLCVRRSGTVVVCLSAGVALGLATLTTARVAVFVPCALLWVAIAGGPTWQSSARNVALVALPLALLIGGWTARNWRAVGAPVLTTDAGERLWIAQNEWTFSHFPVRSIDLSGTEAFARLDAVRERELERLDGQEVARDRLMGTWGAEYAFADPLRTLRASTRKLRVILSAQLSPSRSGVIQGGYFAVFLPVHVLGLLGAWRSRARWPEHSLICLVFLAFACVTVIFYAHTSHKSYLDVFLFVYASAGVAWVGSRLIRYASVVSMWGTQAAGHVP